MRFDYKNVPQIINSFEQIKYHIVSKNNDDFFIILNAKKCSFTELKKVNFNFDPPNGWKAHIELT